MKQQLRARVLLKSVRFTGVAHEVLGWAFEFETTGEQPMSFDLQRKFLEDEVARLGGNSFPELELTLKRLK